MKPIIYYILLSVIFTITFAKPLLLQKPVEDTQSFYSSRHFCSVDYVNTYKNSKDDNTLRLPLHIISNKTSIIN